MTWKPIVGKAFATAEAFSAYVDSVKFGLWRPRFIVVHNTGAPNAAQYAAHWTRAKPITDEDWMKDALEPFYRDQQKWSAGPHLFVTPKNICVFSPLNAPGVHSPSWNAVSWGVETVGDFDVDPFEGPIKTNLAAALGVLHMKAGLQPTPYEKGVRGLHFHREDPRTTHRDCPGMKLQKPLLIDAVKGFIDAAHLGDHQPPSA